VTNAELHASVQRAVDSGSAKVIELGLALNGASIVDSFVRNSRAGRPLMEGMKVYRGSKDPDVDSGTFDKNVKHATPHFSMARGYAETANENIGLVSKETRGLGMLAEYDLPRDAVFYQNFGLESLGDLKHNIQPLSVTEVESLLGPMVSEYFSAENDHARQLASAKLETFCESHLYELSVPSEQKPVRQWVVQQDGQENRLIEHQDRGPLARVMIEVVRLRKAAVDEHSPRKVSEYLRQGGSEGPDRLDAFSSGLMASLIRTGEFIDLELSALRQEALAVSHDSLSDAIAWRKKEQRAIRMTRLTNTGTSIQYDGPRLRTIPLLQRSIEHLEMASKYQAMRPKQMEIFCLLKRAASVALENDRLRKTVESMAQTESRLAAAVTSCRHGWSDAVEQLSALEREHASKLGSGFVLSARYRWTEQKQALEALEQKRTDIGSLDTRLATLSAQWGQALSALKSQRLAAGAVRDQLTASESRLQLEEANGDLCFLPPSAREKLSGLSAQDWDRLVVVATEEMNEADDWIAAGHRAVALFDATATHGLEVGIATYRALVDMSPTVESSRIVASPGGADEGLATLEETIVALVALGEDPVVERAQAIHARLERLALGGAGRHVAINEAVKAACLEMDIASRKADLPPARFTGAAVARTIEMSLEGPI
jgi:hypothetical protein